MKISNGVKKILIIEDEKILSDMYVDKLSQAGFKIISAQTSDEGFAKAKKEKPNLILLDILLPKGNGISFLKKLRANSKIANTKVVVFSNFDDPQTKKEAEELGVDSYLIKTNYTPKEMVNKVKKYLK